ncbi:hypothetical protein F4778DRAFT_385037 [Xylariomycetidae sp. FL2044]|nr:hypothetical protein F4778DRAFT_385037 [Xylariomycetidae sp. FL2044]
MESHNHREAHHQRCPPGLAPAVIASSTRPQPQQQPQQHRSPSVERPYALAERNRSFSVPRHQPSLSDISSTVSTSSLASEIGYPPSAAPTHQPAQFYYAGGHHHSASQAPPPLPPPAPGTTAPPFGPDAAQEPRTPDLPWRPFLARRRVLGAFIALFAGLVVAVEALLDLSTRNGDGAYADSAPGLRYLWAYVSPAILMLTSVAWDRVDYQVRSKAPWKRLARGAAEPGRRTLLLDYVMAAPPVTAWRALNNGDLDVFATGVVALLLKACVVVSTALITVEPGSTGASKSSDTPVQDRLLVHTLPVHLVAGGLALSILLALLALFTVPRRGILPRSPDTLIGVAAICSQSRGLLQRLAGQGAGNEAALQDALRGSRYLAETEVLRKFQDSAYASFRIVEESPCGRYNDADDWGQPAETATRAPILCHPAVRVAGYLFILALVIVLETALQSSMKNGGLGDAGSRDSSLHLLWTVCPALVFLLLYVYLDAVDLTCRILAPYANLRTGGSFESTVNLNYADRSSASVLYTAARLRNFSVLLCTWAALVGSLLAIMSASLFRISTAAGQQNEGGHIMAQAETAYPQSDRLLVQDPVTTRVLEGTLLSILLISALAWPLMRDTAILPARSPATIAHVLALLADGNIPDRLPADAQRAGDGELRRAFADAEAFKMDWAPVRGRARRGGGGKRRERFMIYALRAGGWRGGEEVGLGLVARVAKGHRGFVRGLSDR